MLSQLYYICYQLFIATNRVGVKSCFLRCHSWMKTVNFPHESIVSSPDLLSFAIFVIPYSIGRTSWKSFVELKPWFERFLTVPHSKAMEFALLVFQSGFLLASLGTHRYITKYLPMMKMKKLNPFHFQHLQQVLRNYSLILLLKNVICSPS